MGKIRLAVVGETLYAGRLAECIRKNAPEYLEVFGCQCLQELPDFLEQMRPDILLCEQGSAVEEGLAKDMVQVQLTGELHAKQDGNPGFSNLFVFRYQRASEILRQIFQIYELHSKKNLVYQCKTADMEMAAFYAPGGHELLLPVSISYAALCGAKEKALYLNLSEFSGMLPLFGDKAGNNFSDLIYGIRQKKERFLICLQSVLHHAERFDYVLPPENPEDLYEIQEEDLACLLAMLQEQTEYKRIVWICGTLNQSVVQVMECCGKVFCVVKENSFGKYRKMEFEGFLKKELRQSLREKVRYVCPQTGGGGFVQGVDILTQLQGGEFVKQVERLTKD